MIKRRQWRTRDYHGQSRIEFQKNYKRVRDIVSKSEGDLEKQKKLAKVQADRITDEYKALNRARAAEELGYEEIFEIFFRRAYELGSVSTVSYRDYIISKLID